MSWMMISRKIALSLVFPVVFPCQAFSASINNVNNIQINSNMGLK
jgi:hypothetical protein